MRKLAIAALIAATLSAPVSSFAAQSASLDSRKGIIECADGNQIRTFENDPTIWIFAQKWECKYHSTKTLFEIFEEKIEEFVR